MALAQEGDARLRKRIAELEAENLALRKIVVSVQNAIKAVPPATLPLSTAPSALRIVVMPGDWDGSQLADITKVCESAAAMIASRLPDDGFAPILVERGTSGPITLYKRGEGNEHRVRLDTGGQRWAQCAYQFSHEFCHIVCNYRNVKNPQMWFEETLCETASLYSLRQMAVTWETKPPYSNWKSYSSALASYAQDRIKAHPPKAVSVGQFYRMNQAELEKNAVNRPLNTYIAVQLLPIFEATPDGWQSLRYLNLGPAEENLSFPAYLAGWYDRAPAKHQPFIREIAAQFYVGLPLAKKEN
ncbi:hypothetical protein [Lignipirellula cremea]|uniref:hypothetical protein n=1 Tax=Lignipirellula cremea TaxID=2528010 RepID=UPI0011A91664|nr:hypothetical protein [Lignipirellula cremea]